MTDEQPAHEPGAAQDLRTVAVRLADLQRKCRAASSRSDEGREIERRLTSVLERLEPDPDDEAPIPFSALARELFAVERFFESNGFLGAAKEVAHVMRTLEGLADDGEPAVDPTALLPPEPDFDRGPETPAAPTETDEEEPAVSRWAVPRPLAVVLCCFVVAVLACAAVIYWSQRPEPAESEAGPAVAAVASPTDEQPAPTSTLPPRPADAKPAPGAVLAAEVGEARLALTEGDIDAAVDHLSRAALIDADNTTVLNTATQVVNLLVERSNDAAEGGLWEIATTTLVRAERLATRFGLDSQAIEEARYRHKHMDRFRLVQATDTNAIRSAAGMRVTVYLKDGTTRDSIINGAEGGELLLNEDTEVRGGAMYFVERIPLKDVDYLKIWE